MSFLTLVQRLHLEAGRQGTAPTTVVGQTGYDLRLVNWINDAYKEVQALHPSWRFRQIEIDADGSVSITNAARNYSATDLGFTDVGEWKTNYGDLKLYSAVADESPLDYYPWDDYKDVYLIGSARTTTGRPSIFTVKPDNSLDFHPFPDDTYYLTGEYVKSIQSMAADEDVPLFPTAYHDIVMWRALMLYASHEGAPEVYATGQENYDRILSQMEITELPQIEWRGTLT